MRVAAGRAGPALVEVLEREGAPLALAAARGFGPLKAALLGSVSRWLIERAPVPVMMLPPGAEPSFDGHRIVCAAGPAPVERASKEAGASLAALLGRELVVVSRSTRDPWGPEATGELERLADRAGADITVVPGAGAEPLNARLRESLAVQLSNRARRPVVVVPAPRGNGRDGP
jgi:nucleotide-binding universal stress UspA family protein